MDIIKKAQQDREEYIRKTNLIIQEIETILENLFVEIKKYAWKLGLVIDFDESSQPQKFNDNILTIYMKSDCVAIDAPKGKWGLTSEKVDSIYKNSFNYVLTLKLIEDFLEKMGAKKVSGQKTYIIEQSKFSLTSKEKYETWLNNKISQQKRFEEEKLKKKENEKLQRQKDLETYRKMLLEIGYTFESLAEYFYNNLVECELPKIATSYNDVFVLINTESYRLDIYKTTSWIENICYVTFPLDVINVLKSKPDAIISCDYQKGVFREQLGNILANIFHQAGMWNLASYDYDFALSWKLNSPFFPVLCKLYEIHENEKKRIADKKERKEKELEGKIAIILAKHIEDKEKLKEKVKEVFGQFLTIFINLGCKSVSVMADDYRLIGKAENIQRSLDFSDFLPADCNKQITKIQREQFYASNVANKILLGDFLSLIIKYIQSEFRECYSDLSEKSFVIMF